MNDPRIEALRRAALEELERAPDRLPHSGEFDPVLADVLGGASVRELAGARDDLDRAKRRYEQAIRGARVAGYSWSEIGRVLGESKQALHRRFGDAS
jgi:DNA-directed RNA polymerase specialized sigma24 family protein